MSTDNAGLVTEEMVRRACLRFERCAAAEVPFDESMRSALETALSAMWRPIAEAPRDGTVVLVPLRRWDGRIEVVTTHWSIRDWAGADNPTRFMPLPLAPKQMEDLE